MILFHFPPLTYNHKHLHMKQSNVWRIVFYFFLMTHVCGDLGDPGPPGETIHKAMHYNALHTHSVICFCMLVIEGSYTVRVIIWECKTHAYTPLCPLLTKPFVAVLSVFTASSLTSHLSCPPISLPSLHKNWNYLLNSASPSTPHSLPFIPSILLSAVYSFDSSFSSGFYVSHLFIHQYWHHCGVRYFHLLMLRLNSFLQIAFFISFITLIPIPILQWFFP